MVKPTARGSHLCSLGDRKRSTGDAVAAQGGKTAAISISGAGSDQGDRRRATRRRGGSSIPTSLRGLQIVNGSWGSGR